MKTSSAKNKGRKLQQWVRDQLKLFFGFTDRDVLSRSMGASGTDIVLSDAAWKRFPYAIECKCQEKVSIWAAWEQTKQNTEPMSQPLLIIKKNGEKPLAVVDAEHFILLALAADVDAKGPPGNLL